MDGIKMKFAFFILLIISLSCDSFQIPYRSVLHLHKNIMGSPNFQETRLNAMHNNIGSYLLCLEPTSKTTTINDPTAGMTADEIVNYVSNVGGGMCGYPEIVRTTVGLGLNVSLLLFALMTVGYVGLSIANAVAEKQVTDALKEAETFDRVIRSKKPLAERGPSLADIAEELALPYMGNTGNEVIEKAIAAIRKSAGVVLPEEGVSVLEDGEVAVKDATSSSSEGANRQERRLKRKISKKP